MQRKRISVIVLVVLTVFCMSGCGELIPLTEEEENVIAAYSAHVVSKYNKIAESGMAFVPEEIVEESDVDDTDEEVITDAEEPEVSQEEPEVSEPEDEGAEEPDADEPTADEPEQTEPETNYQSMTQAINIPNINVTYNDYETTASLTESTYFSMNATSGNRFLVLNFTVSNSSSEAAECNIIGALPKFRVTINGSTNALSQATLLLADMSTFSDTLDAGASRDLLLVFEVKEDVLEQIDSLTMRVSMNGSTSEVELE